MNTPIVFVGGGNMASAIIGGLRRSGTPAADLLVLDPSEDQRDKLHAEWGVDGLAQPGPELAQAGTVVWAVKPQSFKEAALTVAPYTATALHFSVMAGIRSVDMARALGTARIVRAMPNTPALIGAGVAGLYARDDVTAAEREDIAALMAPTGRCVWVQAESDLDAVTAVSGSGPAYVFYVIEAMTEAAQRMGLSAAQARELVLDTLSGATELARRSNEAPATLRERVTSKGGTTHAAISVLEAAGVKGDFLAALQAARQRAVELGDEFGA